MPGVYDEIDDIEDLVAAGDLKPSDRYNNKKDVTVRSKKEKNNKNGVGEKVQNGNEVHQSVSTKHEEDCWNER